MSNLEHDVKGFLKFLNDLYVEHGPDNWWVYNEDRLKSLGIKIRDGVFYEVLADIKNLIEFIPNPNRPGGRDMTRMRLTKYGHDNIDNLDPILYIPSENNPKLS